MAHKRSADVARGGLPLLAKRLLLLPMLTAFIVGCQAGSSPTPEVSQAPSAAPSAEPSPSPTAEPNEPRTLRFGHVLAETHPWHQCGVKTFVSEVDRAAVEVTVEVFPGAQLGTNEQMVEALSQGNLDLALPGVGSVSTLYEEFGVLEAPYAFRSLDHLFDVWESEIGRQLIDGAVRVGVRPIGLPWYIGFRHVTANKPVRHPDDLSGVRMRSQDTPISRAIVEALGGSPVPIAFGELYLALSQGVVDAQENPLPNIKAASLHEVQKYLTLTSHVPQTGVLLISEKTWSKLSSGQQAALSAAAEIAAKTAKACIEKAEADILAEFEKEGSPIAVIKDFDRQRFEERAVDVIKNKFGGSWGPLYEQIRNLQ